VRFYYALVVVAVESNDWVVAQQTVLDYESSDRRFRIHGKQHIMSQTKPNDHVYVCFSVVQKLSLKSGIAASLEFQGIINLVFFFDMKPCLVDSATLAQD